MYFFMFPSKNLDLSIYCVQGELMGKNWNIHQKHVVGQSASGACIMSVWNKLGAFGKVILFGLPFLSSIGSSGMQQHFFNHEEENKYKYKI